MKSFVRIVVVVIVLVATYFLLQAVLVLTTASSTSALKPEISLPVLAVVGVLVVLFALTLVAITFSLFSLSDNTQALGLPEGSVRAVIALSLVMLFAILTVYLYGSLSRNGAIVETSVVDRTSKDEITKQLGAQVLYTETVSGRPNSTAANDKATYKIHYRETNNPASEDFAKQMLVLIGTLVTAVSSFYFGAKTATSAQAAVTDALGTKPTPKITGVDPTTWQLAKGAIPNFKVSGSGLDVVKDVKISLSGEPDIIANHVDAAQNVVTCNLPISGGVRAGKWDVTVTDHDNKDTTSTGALTLA